MIRIRAAGEEDFSEISALLNLEGLDRGDLEPGQFLVAVDTETEKLVGCGRIRPHGDALELSGLAVEPRYRGRGIGRRIIERLLEQHLHPPIYLVSSLEGEAYYRPFGFGLVAPANLPQSIQKKYRLYRRELGPNMVVLVRQ